MVIEQQNRKSQCFKIVWSLIRLIVLGVLVCLTPIGCLTQNDTEVVVYTALDEEFSRPILDRFTQQTGIVVRSKFDIESTKTVGLTQEILVEQHRPRCDVFWNNEILNTLRLQRAGLLKGFHPVAAKAYPLEVRSPDGFWHGFAARARVLLVNTELVPKNEWPQSIHDLTDPKWSQRVGIAKPLFGTTATHAACLFAHWGDVTAKEFFQDLKRNAQIVAGNKQVALSVATGVLAFGLTDTDDALIEQTKGMPVAIIYPDQEAGGLGTLFIPNTLALLKDAPHKNEGKLLINYLLSPQVEEQLARGSSGQIPLHPHVSADLLVETPTTVRPMSVDFTKAADHWKTAASFLRQEFATRN